MDSLSHRFARPGTPPMWEQLPNAITNRDFLRGSFAISSCSESRIAPLMKLTVMEPSGIASTSDTLKSRATGQNTMSTAFTTSSTASPRSTTAHLLRHVLHGPPELLRLRCGDPLEADPSVFEAHLPEKFPQEDEPPEGLVVPLAVVAVPRVAPAEENAVRALLERGEDELRIDPPGAHRPDQADVRRVPGPRDPRRVRGDVRAPVAHEGDDPRLELPGRHRDNTPASSSMRCSSSNILWRTAPLGHAATQTPQPLHSTSLIRATIVSRSSSIASYGHSGMQIWQPEHSFSSMYARFGSRVMKPFDVRAIASAAAASAWATVSGMSLGPWHAPAMNTPSFSVATGASFGWRSKKKPSAEQDMFRSRRTSSRSGWGSKATLRTTMSAGMRRTVPRRVSSATTTSFPSSRLDSVTSVTSAAFPRMKLTFSERSRW